MVCDCIWRSDDLAQGGSSYDVQPANRINAWNQENSSYRRFSTKKLDPFLSLSIGRIRSGSGFDTYYGSPGWQGRILNYMTFQAAVDTVQMEERGSGLKRDVYDTVKLFGKLPFHVVEYPLMKPSLHGYNFPKAQDLISDDWNGDGYDELVSWTQWPKRFPTIEVLRPAKLSRLRVKLRL